MFQRLINLKSTNSFLLFGARGTGKSKLLKERFRNKIILNIDLLDPKIEDFYLKDPSRLSDILNEQKKKKLEWVVIDEIQKIPRLLDVVHLEIEKRGTKFALTGSSARKLKRGGANLLAGRAFINNLYPLTNVELGDKFDLKLALRFGTLPKVINLKSISEKVLFLESYVNTYLKEEIVAEQLTRNIIPFKKFLEIAAQLDGKILNFAKIASDIGSDPKTVKTYYEILEDTLIGTLLPAFNQLVRKQQIQSPKFYLFDTGVKRALEGSVVNPTITSQESGMLFEQFIINEFIRLNSYLGKRFRFSYLATKGGAEVDLIIQKPIPWSDFSKNCILVEIKYSDSVSEEQIRHLIALKKEHPKIVAYCICNEKVARVCKGIKIYPWRDGLNQIYGYKKNKTN